MQAGGNQRRSGSRAVAVLWVVCLAASASCGVSSPVPGMGADAGTGPAQPDIPSGDAGTQSEDGGVSASPDGGVGGTADSGFPDAGSVPAECTHTTRRWDATPDGGVYSGRVERHYGAEGKLLQEQAFNAVEELTAEHVYVYEPGGRLSDERSTFIQNGMATSTASHMTYDADGRLLTRTTTTRSPTLSSKWVQRTYDAYGHLLREEHLEEQGGYRSQWRYTYSYDAQGRLSTVELFFGEELRLRRVATYDAQGRLARVDESGPSAGGADLYTYPDEGGWTTQHQAPGWSETWRYDAQGRLLDMRWGDHSGTGGASFSFDAAGRLLTHREWSAALRRWNSEGQTHTYDTEGRRTRSETERRWSDSHTYPVDRFDQRTLTTYTYDAAGQFRMREERVLHERSGFEGREWESAPPGLLLERTEARGRTCLPPPDAPPPHDAYAFPP